MLFVYHSNLSSNFKLLFDKQKKKFFVFYRKDFADKVVSPKMILHQYSRDNEFSKPIYKTEEKKPERIYKAVVEFNGVFYTSPFW